MQEQFGALIKASAGSGAAYPNTHIFNASEILSGVPSAQHSAIVFN
jgi:hypothetical protein